MARGGQGMRNSSGTVMEFLPTSDAKSFSHEYMGGYLDGLCKFLEVVNWFVVLPLCYLVYRQSVGFFAQGLPGFTHAPVTKALIFLTSFSTLWAMLSGGPTPVSLHWWRFGLGHLVVKLTTYQLYFHSIWSAACGCVMLYQFRVFERQWGASKVRFL